MTEPECAYADSCSVLAPNPDIIPGGTFWLRQVDRLSASILIIATNLPSPSSFDPSFTTYWYSVQNEIVPHKLIEISAGVWWTSHTGTDVVVPFPPDALILVQPGTSQEPGEPVVLSGTVGRSCS